MVKATTTVRGAVMKARAAAIKENER